MNKISKKILAIVTMVAFVVTMMPFAAFAAPVEPDNSTVQTAEEDVVVDTNTDVKINLSLNDINGDPSTADDAVVYVWAEKVTEDGEGDGQPIRGITFTDGSGNTSGDWGEPVVLQQGRAIKLTGAHADAYYLNAKFAVAGEYIIKAGVDLDGTDDEVITSVDQLLLLDNVDNHAIITVEGPVIDVASATITKVKGAEVEKDTTTANTWNTTLENNNGVTSNVVKVQLLDSKDKPVAEKEVAVTGAAALNMTVKDMSGNVAEDGIVTTNKNGEFQIQYTTEATGLFKIYIDAENTELDNYRATLNVTAGDPAAREADTIVANEKDITIDVEDSLANAVTFTITDDQGDVVTTDETKTGGFMATEPAVVGGDADYVKLLDKPAKFRGEATDFKLVYDEKAEAYTLACAEDLVAGEYTVRVYLESGNYADATFTVGKFNSNKVVEMSVATEDETVPYSNGKIVYHVYAVDANGISKEITDNGKYTLGLNYTSSINGLTVAKDADKNTVSVNYTGNAKEDVLGQEITLVAASNVYNKLATATVTIADLDANTATLTFDKTEGKVGVNNKVVASVVDADGDVVKGVNGLVFAYIADQSNEDANIDLSYDSNASSGKADLTLYSDKETTVDVVVGIQSKSEDEDSAIYAATLEYTFGEAEVDADTTVAMTIGSSDIIVNNDIVSGDAAPYVDSNWRTMVPLRALTEAFGGTAEWDGDARTVTVENGDITIVFDADSNKYTVNDEEKEMDTNLVINDGRTYVPVRFVAEELGYQITVLKDAQNLTAGVVFQK